MFLAWVVVATVVGRRPIFEVNTTEEFEVNVVAVGPTYDYIMGCDPHPNDKKVLQMSKLYECSPAECINATNVTNGTDATAPFCQAQNTGMLEELIDARGPMAFANEMVLHESADNQNITEVDGILTTYNAPLDAMTSNRMMPGTDSRCATEYCPKGPCVMLEMNYFGTAVMSPKTMIDDQNKSWRVVLGETYCGPAAGTTLPFANVITKKPLPSDSFPQDRPVPALFSPSQHAGIVLPLSAPSNNPDWYYVEGAWGWRTNGVVKKSGMPCYGRTVPRWMLPNVCLKQNPAEGCVNGVSMDNLFGSFQRKGASQFTHTMVDEKLGFNGMFTENGGVKTYDDDNDQFYKDPIDNLRDLLPILSKDNNAFPAAFMLAPFFGLPGSGAHGYSHWRPDQHIASTNTLRVPFSSTDNTWLTRLTTSQQTTGISSLPLRTVDVVQQFAELTPQADHPDDVLPASHSMHSHRRLMAFTPKGMISTESFVESGTRIFHHPLFKHKGDTGAPTEHFVCDGANDCHHDSGKNVYYDEELKEHNASFVASFINIDQAMVAYGSQQTNATNSSDPIEVPQKFRAIYELPYAAGFWKYWQTCAPHGSSVVKAQSGTCCLVPVELSDSKKAKRTLFEYALDKNVLGSPKITAAKIFEDIGLYVAGVGIVAGVKAAKQLATPAERKDKVNQWGSTCRGLINEFLYPNPPGDYANLWRMFNKLDNLDAFAVLLRSKYETEEEVSNLMYCLKYLVAPMSRWDLGTTAHKRYYNGVCYDADIGKRLKADNRDFFVPTNTMINNINVVRDAPYHYYKHWNSTAGLNCTKMCHVDKFNVSRSLGNRQLCASQCQDFWKPYLITPMDVNIHFAAKYKCNDKSGYGGRINTDNLTTTCNKLEFVSSSICRQLPLGKKNTHPISPITIGTVLEVFQPRRSKKPSDTHAKCVDVDPDIWSENPSVGLFEQLTSAHHRLLASDGQFMASIGDMSKTRTGQGESTESLSRDPIAILLDATGIGALAMLFVGSKIKHTSSTYSAHHTSPASEGAVDEGVCDLAVCDIARDKSKVADYASIALRCMPRGYSFAQFNGGDFDDEGGAAEFGNCGQVGSNQDWFNPNFTDPGLCDYAKYPFTIAAASGATKQFKKTPADYTAAESVNVKVTINHEFKQTPRDAGYSQKHHDKNNNACECDFEGIEMHTEIVTDEVEVTRFLGDPPTKRIHEYLPNMHKLVQLSLSWVAIRNNAKIGLFMGGTGGQTEWVERDLMYRKDDGAIIEAEDTYDRFLQPGAPIATEHAQSFVYTRVAGKTTVSEEDAPRAAYRGLTRNNYVREWLSVTSSSCVRFPIGVLHRSQMTKNISEAIYGPEDEANHTFHVNDETLFSPTMQGYCEKVNGMYRFCPGDVFSNADDRQSFCDDETLARNFVMGISIRERPLDRRCSIKYNLCVVVPGSPGESRREGLITAHTGIDFEGYTILVTPFNFSSLMDMLHLRRLVPMYTPNATTEGYLLKDPDKIQFEEMTNISDTNYKIMGFGSNDDFFSLMSNVEAYIDRRGNVTIENVTDWLRLEIDNGMVAVFEAGKVTGKSESMTVHAHNMRGTNKAMRSSITCKRGEFWVPEFDHTLPISRQCWTADELYPEHPETGVVVAGDGIKVMSASTERPLRFGGEYPGASTCTRFFMMSRNAHVEMEVDQTKCMNRFDTFHSTAIRFLGTNVSGSSVDIQKYEKLKDDEVAVSLVGADVEFTKVPTELAANNVSVSIPSDRVGSFDVACARVHGSVKIIKPGKDVHVLVQAVEGTELVLHGNGFPCYDGDFTQPLTEDCTFVNVTAYTSLFGSKFEHRAFRRGVKSFTIAWVLLVTLIIIAIVLVAYIVCSNLPARTTDDDDDGDDDDGDL